MSVLTELEGEKYLNLETFKRNGDGVKTPIWFAHEGDGLVFMTDGRSWKCKRLRRNDAVKVAACGVAGGIKGDWFAGTCRLSTDKELATAISALAEKYGLIWKLTGFGARLRGSFKHRAYYRITPAEP